MAATKAKFFTEEIRFSTRDDEEEKKDPYRDPYVESNVDLLKEDPYKKTRRSNKFYGDDSYIEKQFMDGADAFE